MVATNHSAAEAGSNGIYKPPPPASYVHPPQTGNSWLCATLTAVTVIAAIVIGSVCGTGHCSFTDDNGGNPTTNTPPPEEHLAYAPRDHAQTVPSGVLTPELAHHQHIP